jgi:hypothetical protein
MAILRGGTCGTVDNNLTATTPDGSGYVLTTAVASIPPATVNTTANKVYVSPANATSGSGSGTDRNGNVITANTNGTFTDTLGTTALTVAGTAPSNTTFSYTAPSGASPAYAMSYKTYTVKTNFGCSVADCGPTSNSLVDRITLPDGTFYAFTYEATPGYSGDVTGRLASVTLPTGGTITYAYTGGSSGHITCADGSTSGLTRTTPDSTTPWTYARVAGSEAAYTTTVTDPMGNDTKIQFQGLYETARSV